LLRKSGKPVYVADGKGGAIIAWQDYRNSATTACDVYAQRINSKGQTLWTKDGVVVSKEVGDQLYPNLVGDDSGGVIISWHDEHTDSGDIYAQRLDTDGKPLWKENGIAICQEAGSQLFAGITQDGTGGAIVPICAANGDQYDYSIVGDNKGGAFITWRDMRDENWRIYAQKVDADGKGIWEKDGILVSAEKGSQYNPNMVSDGVDGVIITWWDQRDVVSDIYAQRIDANGKSLWVKGGAAICTAEGGQQDPYPVNSGIGSAIIVWWDKRKVDADIYAQRVFSE
jgi:hypothetical protein